LKNQRPEVIDELKKLVGVGVRLGTCPHEVSGVGYKRVRVDSSVHTCDCYKYYQDIWELWNSIFHINT